MEDNREGDRKNEDMNGVIPMNVDILKGLIVDARKVVVHGAAHLSNVEMPEDFNNAVPEFLDVD